MLNEQIARESLPFMWRPDERYIATCARCGCEGLKKRMTSFYVKRGAYSNLKILCHFCEDCYVAFLDEFSVAEG
ncbi:MAG: hypothetical protein IJV74_06895 [Clostridia bacterium]|nr:hypothetical protein [Clostridia bacterium]